MLLALLGCEPEPGDTGLFTVIDSTESERSYFIPDRFNIGVGTAGLGAAANDINQVRYGVDGQRRSFLLQGDLRSGFTGADYLHLPISLSGSPTQTVDIAPFDTSKWASFRVYDAGLCSIHLGWEGGELNDFLEVGSLIELFVGAIDGAVQSSTNVVNGRRTSDGLVEVSLQALPGPGAPYLSQDRDTVRINATYFADRVEADSGAQFGCSDVHLVMAIEFGFRRIAGAISNAPGCNTPGDPGSVLQLDDGFHFDHDGVVYDANVAVIAGACDLIGLQALLATSLEDALRNGLPDAVRRAVQNAGLIDPRRFEINPFFGCTCDSDCNAFSPIGGGNGVYGFEAGRRSRCHFDGEPAPGAGECWIQLEIDRLNVRPDGLEIVIMEDAADRQLPLLEASFLGLEMRLCEENRDGVNESSVPDLATLSQFTVPAPP